MSVRDDTLRALRLALRALRAAHTHAVRACGRASPATRDVVGLLPPRIHRLQAEVLARLAAEDGARDPGAHEYRRGAAGWCSSCGATKDRHAERGHPPGPALSGSPATRAGRPSFSGGER